MWKHFGTDLDRRTVIHAWLSREALINATSLGYRAIWSVDGQYYLDALNEPWTSFYDVDILAGVTNASAIPLILGAPRGRRRPRLCAATCSRPPPLFARAPPVPVFHRFS